MELDTSLGNLVRPCLKNKKKKFRLPGQPSDVILHTLGCAETQRSSRPEHPTVAAQPILLESTWARGCWADCPAGPSGPVGWPLHYSPDRLGIHIQLWLSHAGIFALLGYT